MRRNWVEVFMTGDAQWLMRAAMLIGLVVGVKGYGLGNWTAKCLEGSGERSVSGLDVVEIWGLGHSGGIFIVKGMERWRE